MDQLGRVLGQVESGRAAGGLDDVHLGQGGQRGCGCRQRPPPGHAQQLAIDQRLFQKIGGQQTERLHQRAGRKIGAIQNQRRLEPILVTKCLGQLDIDIALANDLDADDSLFHGGVDQPCHLEP